MNHKPIAKSRLNLLKAAFISMVLAIPKIDGHAQTNYTPYTFTIFAGSGSGTEVNGTGTNASFYNPASITTDAAGNVYVTDPTEIRAITPSGVVTTALGLPYPEGYGCQNTTNVFTNNGISFGSLTGIALLNGSNFYVYDDACGNIRQVSTSDTNWVASPVAGPSDADGYQDGPGYQALFSGSGEGALAGDADGNLYLADAGNQVIRKISFADGGWTVSTPAGKPGTGGTADGTNSDARFSSPTGIAVDGAGVIYVADRSSHTIRKIVQSGTNWIVTTIAGQAGVPGFADGEGTNSLFHFPWCIAADAAGNLYVTDTYNYVIRKLSQVGTNWVVTTMAGLPGNPGNAAGTGSGARFYLPYSITVDATGTVYVCDDYYQNIRKGVPATVAPLVISSPQISAGQFSFDLIGPSGQTVRVFASSDLAHWVPIWTNTLGSSPLPFSDGQSGNFTERFYKAVSP
jgi:hypothetical protein